MQGVTFQYGISILKNLSKLECLIPRVHSALRIEHCGSLPHPLKKIDIIYVILLEP